MVGQQGYGWWLTDDGHEFIGDGAGLFGPEGEEERARIALEGVKRYRKNAGRLRVLHVPRSSTTGPSIVSTSMPVRLPRAPTCRPRRPSRQGRNGSGVRANALRTDTNRSAAVAAVNCTDNYQCMGRLITGLELRSIEAKE